MSLPSPLFMSALGGSLLVAAGLIFFFLKLLQISIYIGAAGSVLLLCAGVAMGYERMGEAKIQPKLDAANALAAEQKGLLDKQTAYANQLNDLWQGAHAASEFRGQQVEKLQNENEQLARAGAAKLPTSVANQRVDGRAVCLLDGTCAATTDAGAKGQASAVGVVAGGSPGTPANPTVAVSDASLAAVVDWGITCRARYESARSQIAEWITYFNSLFPGATP